MAKIHNPQNQYGQDLTTKIHVDTIVNDKIIPLEEGLKKSLENITTDSEYITINDDITEKTKKISLNVTSNITEEDTTTIPDTVAVKKYIDNHTIYNGVNSNNWNIIQDGSSAFTTSLEDLPSSMPSLTVATGMFEGNSAITEFNIKVPNLVIADNMFSGCTNLTTIDSSFQNVVSATNMFENCPLTSIKLTQPGFANLTEAATYTTDETTNKTTKEKGLFDSAKETLVTLKASMPSLTKGAQLLEEFTALESYNGNLNQLEDGNAMFKNCSSMTSFSGDLSSLSNGRWMFGNSSLSSWDNDMPKLKDGYAMYYNVPLKYFNGSLAALEDGSYMFDGCSKLEDFSSDLTSLTNGYQMFSRNGLINFTTTSLRSLENAEGMFRANSGSVSPLKNFTVKDNDMSKVTNAPWMFQGCGNLVEFDCDLSSLENGTAMFQACTSLKTVETQLPALTTGGLMFGGCSSLTRFDIELPLLKDGSAMFENCTSLTSFISDLPSLTNGEGMFNGCKLDKDSVLSIINCLKTTNTCANAAKLTLSIDASLRNDSDILTALGISEGATSAEIAGYGGGTWTVTLQWNS